MTEKAVVILSGGMDSTTLLYDIVDSGAEVYAVSFDYGQKHIRELFCAKKTCKILNVPHRIINLKILNDIAPSALTRKDVDVPEGDYKDDNMKQTVVPNRNMVMLSLATVFAISIKATKLYYGAHSGDHTIYPDCRPEFVEVMKTAIELADWNKVELDVPYLFIHKGEIVHRGIKLNVDFKNTWTCYKGKEKACGMCGACRERLEAFYYAGIKDPIEYEEFK